MLRSMAIRNILAFAAFACASLPATSGATHPHERNGFMIGFGLGGGSLGIEDEEDVGDVDREGSFVGSFRIGGAVRPDLVIHFEGVAWTKEFEEPIGDVTWSFSTAAAALTFYPNAGGAYLRGGLGLSVVNAELEIGGVTISDDETGFGALVAAGYEWRLTRKFALGPHGEFVYMNFDDFGSANLFAGQLDFNWYW